MLFIETNKKPVEKTVGETSPNQVEHFSQSWNIGPLLTELLARASEVIMSHSLYFKLDDAKH